MVFLLRISVLATLLSLVCAQDLSSIAIQIPGISSLLGQASSLLAAPSLISSAAPAPSRIASAASSVAPPSRIASALSSVVAGPSSLRPPINPLPSSVGSALSSLVAPSTPTKSIVRVLSTTFVTSTTQTQSSPSASVEPAADTGLSTGAKAGIGVVVPLAVLLLLGFLFLQWRKKRRAASASNPQGSAIADTHMPPMAHSGLMVPAYEDPHEPSKPELDSTVTTVPPSATTSPPPMYTHRQPSGTNNSTPQELAAEQPNAYGYHTHDVAMPNASPPVQPSELSSVYNAPADVSHTIPADVGPAIVIPTPYREEEAQLEHLRAQRAKVARERERKEEIDRMRAEEERLDRAITELESRRY